MLPHVLDMQKHVPPFPPLDVGRWAFDVFRLNTELVEFIRQTIRSRGPQSFAWFMQQALYHPEHGFVVMSEGAKSNKRNLFAGESLLAFAKQQLLDDQVLADAKRLTRLALKPLLGHYTLKTKALFRQE